MAKHSETCPSCGKIHAGLRKKQSLMIGFDVLVVEVTREVRHCENTNSTWHNTKDHDYIAEARDKLKKLMGNRVGTRIPGMKIISEGNLVDTENS